MIDDAGQTETKLVPTPFRISVKQTQDRISILGDTSDGDLVQAEVELGPMYPWSTKRFGTGASSGRPLRSRKAAATARAPASGRRVANWHLHHRPRALR